MNSAEFSGDGRRLVSAAADGTVIVWDRQSASPMRIVAGRHSPAVCAKFLQDSDWLTIASADNSIGIWSVEKASEGLRLSTALARHPAFDVSPDGKLVATSVGTDVKFWQSADVIRQAKNKLGMI